MYIVSEPNYATTNWYGSCIEALKGQARRKRVVLTFADRAEEAAGERCVFVLGASVVWLKQTVAALQASGAHPILLNELPDYPFVGRYSCVKTDYGRFMSMANDYFRDDHRKRIAFYGMNRASFSDISRKNAFEACFSEGTVFENNGSLARCFEDFYREHQKAPFDAVVCANDFAAVSLRNHLIEADCRNDVCIVVHSNAQLLTFFPDVVSWGMDYGAVASAAFEIADCMTANPNFSGMRVTVEPLAASDVKHTEPTTRALHNEEQPSDALYADTELSELMRIEKLLSSCDETDIKILHLLYQPENMIGESTYLSDNGVKYRIKKMKKICGVISKAEIPILLSRYGIHV